MLRELPIDTDITTQTVLNTLVRYSIEQYGTKRGTVRVLATRASFSILAAGTTFQLTPKAGRGLWENDVDVQDECGKHIACSVE